MTTMETKILHERWRGARGRMVPEWRDDFEAYKSWCIEHGWTPEIMARKVANGRGLLGPDTAHLTAMLVCGGPLEDMKPGWKNRPCASCAYEARQTFGSCPCRAYLAWWNVTMVAYRRALMGKEEA